ncbi:MAG: FemAB family PEP-CTERM system-associated protein [Calditrichaeota bacterium]|nr:FemAB family PEP-CTERM system-associated protein [Calditrichota bacterium]
MPESYLTDTKIRELKGDFSSWDKYVKSHSKGTIYHLSSWKRAVENTFHLQGRYYVLCRDEKILGVLPLFLVKTLFSGLKLVSIPFAVYGGILANSLEIRKELLNYAINLSKELGANHLELRNLGSVDEELLESDLYVTYIRELEKDDEAVLLSIPRKSRASIRNGYKKYNLTVKVDQNLDLLFHLYSLNKRKLGSPQYPRIFFENLLIEFREQAGIMTVYTNGIPAASVLFFYYQDTILPYFSGSDDHFFHTNANNVMYYELMKHALDKGLKYFDFGRSRKNTGSSKFKENMGFTPMPLHYNYYLRSSEEIPDISPSNNRFQLAIKMWSHLPLPVTKFLGPKLVKYLP